MSTKDFLSFVAFCCISLALVSADITGKECTDINDGVFYPSSLNCSAYYVCFDNEFHLLFCENDYFFNEAEQNCEFPSNINCGREVTTTPGPGFPGVECTDGIVFQRHPTSCNKFILCFAGIPIERSCSPGLYWNIQYSRCVRRPDSDCVTDVNVCPISNDPNDIVIVPNDEDCQTYFICYDGEPVKFDCGDGFHFDPVYNWCVLEEDSKCVPEFPDIDIKEIECPASTGNDIILLPHPEECNYYFICLDGISVLMRCARTLLFDYLKQQCFFEETAVCFNRKRF